MSTPKNDILQGTLTLLVLKTLASNKRMHGYAITTHVQRVSADLLRVEEGSLYPALHRMEQHGWLRSEWGITEKNREARFYSLTAKGRKQLARRRRELGPLHRGCRPGASLRLTRAEEERHVMASPSEERGPVPERIRRTSSVRSRSTSPSAPTNCGQKASPTTRRIVGHDCSLATRSCTASGPGTSMSPAGSMRLCATSAMPFARSVTLPASRLIVVLTLALGIGANTAVFSAIDAILLRPLPFPDGDRLVRILQKNSTATETPVAPVRLEDWNRLNSTFEGITGFYTEDVSETSADLPERITARVCRAALRRGLGDGTGTRTRLHRG